MAVQKNLTNTSLVMEVSTGTTDEKGNTIYKNKVGKYVENNKTNFYIIPKNRVIITDIKRTQSARNNDFFCIINRKEKTPCTKTSHK